jgi:hypothetical protein
MDDILSQLLEYQRKDLRANFRLDYGDLKRLSRYIDTNFFTDQCCYWKGFKTSKNESNYITFYYKKKKVSLYRILYYNFVDELEKSEYIRCSCPNKGLCCNVQHLTKKTVKSSKKEE